MTTTANEAPQKKSKTGKTNWFTALAGRSSGIVGSPAAFGFATGSVIVWALLGPRFNYSDTWQLVINTGTSVLTFLIVFLIQNTQNRDARALHLKLDELIRAVHTAENRLIRVEKGSDEEMDQLAQHYEQIRTENQ